jgi:RecA-family ATPase
VDFSDPSGHETEVGALVPFVAARRMQWRDLDGRTPPERTWLISHWLTYGITLLAGRGGIGKSLLAQTVGTALALGRTFIDEVREPQTVLMWSCEDDHDEVWRRQIAINTFFGCSMADIDGRLIIESRVGATNSMWVMHFGALTAGPALKEWHEQINDLRAGVAILDNIAHAFGGNENDRHHVTSFVNGLASATERPLATILLGHTARSQGSEFAGSAAWENAARMRWLFDSKLPDQKQDDDQQPEDGVRYLAKRKANYSTNDWRRLAYQAGVFAVDGESVATGGYALASHQEQARRVVLNGLRKLTDMGIPTTRAANSPACLPRLLLEMNLAEDFSRNDLGRAMNNLLVDGHIAIGVIGKYDKGGERTGLLITSPK